MHFANLISAILVWLAFTFNCLAAQDNTEDSPASPAESDASTRQNSQQDSEEVDEKDVSSEELEELDRLLKNLPDKKEPKNKPKSGSAGQGKTDGKSNKEREDKKKTDNKKDNDKNSDKKAAKKGSKGSDKNSKKQSEAGQDLKDEEPKNDNNQADKKEGNSLESKSDKSNEKRDSSKSNKDKSGQSKEEKSRQNKQEDSSKTHKQNNNSNTAQPKPKNTKKKTSQKPLSKKHKQFVINELKMILTKEDDVALDGLTKKGRYNQMSGSTYINEFWRHFDEALRFRHKLATDKFLQTRGTAKEDSRVMSYLALETDYNYPGLPITNDKLRFLTFLAIKEGNIRDLRALQNNFDVLDFTDEDGNNLLAFAIIHNQPEIAKLLLYQGFDDNSPNKSGLKPSYLAYNSDNPEIQKLYKFIRDNKNK